MHQAGLNLGEGDVRTMEGAGSTAMAVAMLAAFALIFGGIMLARRREERKRGILMIAAAAVLGCVDSWDSLFVSGVIHDCL